MESVFYIRGLTKNAYDWLFNQMKLKYHKKYIFLWSEVIQNLDTKENVRIIDAQETIFMDYGSMIDTFYDKFKWNTIQRNHSFKVEHTDTTLSMQCSTHDGAPLFLQRIVKQGQVLVQERTTTMSALLLEQSKPPGLRPVKEVEMFKKFHPCVPRKYWENTCSEPSEKVLTQVKNEIITNRKNKAATTNPKITLTTTATKAPAASKTKER
jgi:hypothetical protein